MECPRDRSGDIIVDRPPIECSGGTGTRFRLIVGNTMCWYGNLRYVTKDIEDPKQKLLQIYKTREKKYGTTNVGKKAAQKGLVEWCKICGIRTETVNNMWARKTMINRSLHDLLLPEQEVMNLSGHKSAVQMRKDYCMFDN